MSDEKVFQLCHCSVSPIGITCYQQTGTPDDTTTAVTNQRVIVTFETLGVQVYNIEDKKNVYSWSVGPGTNLTTAAVYHPQSNNFLCVENGNTIVKWSPTQQLIKGERREFPHTIHSLHVCDAYQGVLLVCDNGLVALISSSDLSSVHKCAIKKKSSVVSAFLSPHSKAPELLVLRQSNTKASTSFADIYNFRSTAEKKEEILSIASHNLTSPINTQLVSGNINVHLRSVVVIWSDGTMQVLKFPTGVSPWQSFASVPTITLQRAIQGSSVCSYLPNNLIAVLTDNDNNLGVSVWEGVYGTLQATQQLLTTKKRSRSSKSSSNDSSQFCVSVNGQYSVCLLKNSIDVLHNSDLQGGSSLAFALGKMAPPTTTTPTTTPTMDYTPTPPTTATVDYADLFNDSTEPGTLLTAFQKQANTATNAELKILQKLVPDTLSETPTQSEFEKIFYSYIKKQKQRRKKARTSKNTSTSVCANAYLSHSFVVRVTARCLEMQHWGVLSDLLHSHLLSARTYPTLLQEIMKHKKYNLLHASLLCIHDMSETQLVSCLSFVIKELKDEKNKSQHSELTGLLDCVFCCPRSDVFLREALSELDSDGCECVLSRLLYWMNYYYGDGGMAEGEQESKGEKAKKGDKKKKKNEEEEKEEKKEDTPKFSQVLDWVSICLDSHFTDVSTLSQPTIIELLNKLGSVCNLQLNCCEKMTSVHGMVGALVKMFNHKELQAEEVVGDYVVEVLEL